MKRFPLRTLLLMIVALVLFVRLWCATHPDDEADGRGGGVDVTVRSSAPDGGATGNDGGR